MYFETNITILNLKMQSAGEEQKTTAIKIKGGEKIKTFLTLYK